MDQPNRGERADEGQQRRGAGMTGTGSEAPSEAYGRTRSLRGVARLGRATRTGRILSHCRRGGPPTPSVSRRWPRVRFRPRCFRERRRRQTRPDRSRRPWTDQRRERGDQTGRDLCGKIRMRVVVGRRPQAERERFGDREAGRDAFRPGGPFESRFSRQEADASRSERTGFHRRAGFRRTLRTQGKVRRTGRQACFSPFPASRPMRRQSSACEPPSDNSYGERLLRMFAICSS